MPGAGEADDIMAMSAADSLALTERVKAREPGAVRRQVLYGVWKQIRILKKMDARQKVQHFRGVCALLTDIEVA